MNVSFGCCPPSLISAPCSAGSTLYIQNNDPVNTVNITVTVLVGGVGTFSISVPPLGIQSFYYLANVSNYSFLLVNTDNPLDTLTYDTYAFCPYQVFSSVPTLPVYTGQIFEADVEVQLFLCAINGDYGQVNTITASILSGPPGAILSGTLVQQWTNSPNPPTDSFGEASFPDLSLNVPGDYEIGFSNGCYTGVLLLQICDQLTIVVQPNSVVGIGEVIPITLNLLKNGVLDTSNSTSVVTVSLYSNEETDPTLHGTLQVQANAGVVNFTDLWISVADTWELHFFINSEWYPPNSLITPCTIATNSFLVTCPNVSSYEIQLTWNDPCIVDWDLWAHLRGDPSPWCGYTNLGPTGPLQFFHSSDSFDNVNGSESIVFNDTGALVYPFIVDVIVNLYAVHGTGCNTLQPVTLTYLFYGSVLYTTTFNATVSQAIGESGDNGNGQFVPKYLEVQGGCGNAIPLCWTMTAKLVNGQYVQEHGPGRCPSIVRVRSDIEIEKYVIWEDGVLVKNCNVVRIGKHDQYQLHS